MIILCGSGVLWDLRLLFSDIFWKGAGMASSDKS